MGVLRFLFSLEVTATCIQALRASMANSGLLLLTIVACLISCHSASGAGCGCYTSYLRDVAHAESVTAYDGIPNIRNLTRGLVSEADLTVNLSSLIRAHDWTLCTEVTEHIPGEFEQTALANIVRPARCGVLLSLDHIRASFCAVAVFVVLCPQT